MPETVKCELCEKSFSSVSKREDHQVEVHVDSKEQREARERLQQQNGTPPPRNRVIYGG